MLRVSLRHQHALAAAHIGHEVERLRTLRPVVDVADHHVSGAGHHTLQQGGKRTLHISIIQARTFHHRLNDLDLRPGHVIQRSWIGIGEGRRGGDRGNLHAGAGIMRIFLRCQLRFALLRPRSPGHEQGGNHQKAKQHRAVPITSKEGRPKVLDPGSLRKLVYHSSRLRQRKFREWGRQTPPMS